MPEPAIPTISPDPIVLVKRLTFCVLIAALIPGLVQAAALSQGDYRFELQLDGRARSYLVHMPSQPLSSALPVVINLHGGGGNAQQHRQSSLMDAAADRDGYIAVYPNGSGRLGDRLLTWNAGSCCGYAQTTNVNDVEFIARLIDDLGQRTAVDTRRIYVVGHSNGGMMAHRIGESLSNRIAAIASVAGAHVPDIRRGRALPVLHIHSIDDPRALYHGGLGPPFPFTSNRVLHPSVDATLSAWIRWNGCAPSPLEEVVRESGGHTALELRYGHCRDGSEVVLWKLTGAGHGWPGGVPARESLVGPATKVIDANTEIWRFFSRFALPSE